MNNGFQQMWAEIKKLWNHAFTQQASNCFLTKVSCRGQITQALSAMPSINHNENAAASGGSTPNPLDEHT